MHGADLVRFGLGVQKLHRAVMRGLDTPRFHQHGGAIFTGSEGYVGMVQSLRLSIS